MTWQYNVREAKFYRDKVYQFDADYAGAVGYYNNPDMECEKNKGPLPRGRYTITEPATSAKTGKYTLGLIPNSSNNMCGRSEFRIHGDSRRDPGTASEGCIVIRLQRRKDIWRSNDRELIVE